MAKWVTIYEKPTSHLALPDWYTKQWELKESAKKLIDESQKLRNVSRTIRNETKIQTDWAARMNDLRLDDRVKELKSWHDIFGKLLARLDDEKKKLQEERSEAEKDLENIELPLKIVGQCVSMRDCRRGSELTYDEADTELKKELTIIEAAKQSLNDKIHAAWLKGNKLEEVIFKVNLDHEDKTQSIDIDYENLILSKNSAGVSCKPNVLRIPKSSKTYSTWSEHCCKMKLLAENELEDAYSFREAINVMRKRAKIEIEAQQDLSDYSLRKRIYQTQKSRNEMDWQKTKTENEMDTLLKELHKLEESLREKTNFIKCAETRLENRTYRPGFELCRDESEFGLNDEVLQLKKTRQDLLSKIKCSKATYNGLEALLIQIQRNLNDKQHSMMTDIMCLDTRSTLKRGDRSKLPNETDRNIVLTQLDEEIPLES